MAIRLLPDLRGQTALVTGATRGIGARITLGLAELGATVYAGARDPADLEGIEAEFDGRIRPVRLDVRDEAQVHDAVRSAVTGTGRLDVLVNNAGIGDFRGRQLAGLDTAVIDDVLATNLRGPMLMCREALPHLLQRPGGRIINLSSGMGALGEGMSGTAPTYRISKTAVNGLTAYLHGEYGGRGLIAASVCPGWVRTEMGGQGAPRSADEGADTPIWIARFAPGGPGGRFWRDREVIDW